MGFLGLSTPHHYVDEVLGVVTHRYRQCRVVCRPVTIVSPAKWLNWMRCHLGCGLGLAQGTTY